jgi:hypothetical protein
MTLLAYDPVRLAALARTTRAAADELAAVTSAELFAVDAVTTSHGVAVTLDETLLGSLQALLANTALTDWTGVAAVSGITVLTTVDELIAALDAPAVDSAPPIVLDSTEFTLAAAITTGGDWFHDVNGQACAPFAGGSYSGGGYVTGPDGERYPIVIPRVETAEGDVYTADLHGADPDEPCVATLGASDPGWEVVARATGIERFQEEPESYAPLVGFFAGMTGQVRPLPPNSALARIAVRADGPPALVDEPPSAGPVIALPSAANVDPADSSPGVVVDGAVALAVMSGQGIVMAGGMDNQTERAYQVIFEENADGRRRARLQTFTLADDGDGGVVIIPQHVFVDADGRLISQTISYGSPYDTPGVYLTSATADVPPYALSGDEPFTTTVPSAVFP